MHTDLIRELGPLAFASRLQRLSERLMHDVASVYADYDSDFEPRWFPVAYLLNQRKSMSVTQIANVLGYTHPAVVQIVAAMDRRGLIKSRSDAGDGRRRILSLSPRGRQTIARIAPVWDAVSSSTKDIIAGSGHDVLGVLDSVERELDRQELLPRIRQRLHSDNGVEIIPFRKTLASHFGRLNREWLGHDVPLEPHDRVLIDNPSAEIINKGGMILFARAGREIVGTVAVIPHPIGAVEIAKMAVTPKHRGRGIGRSLAMAAIAWARQNGSTQILIATSPKLKHALALYRSLGFVEIPPDREWKSQYRRKTIFMRLDSPNTTDPSNKE